MRPRLWLDKEALDEAQAVNPRLLEELDRAEDFLNDMKDRLVEKAENGRDRDWREVGLLYLLGRLQEETGEVARALLAGRDLGVLIAQCADVANISMMIADRARDLRGRADEEPRCPACGERLNNSAGMICTNATCIRCGQ